MGLVAIWFMTVTGLSTIAALAAFLFRELDQPVVRHFLGGLGFRTDISRGFFPVTVLIVLWLVCWCISFFRASGNMARAQGRAAAKLMPVTVVSFGICVAALLGNGEFGLEWLSSPNGVDIAGLFSSAEKFFQLVLYGVIGVGLLPFLNPAALIRSGARPKSSKDRVVFAVASRVLLYGLPFLLVSWFARENISSWTEHRFVTEEIRSFKLRSKDVVESNAAIRKKRGTADGSHAEHPYVSSDFVALTRHEIASWSDWQPAWAPLWVKLRDESDKDVAARVASRKQLDATELAVRSQKKLAEKKLADAKKAAEVSAAEHANARKASDAKDTAKSAASQAKELSKRAEEESKAANAAAKKMVIDAEKATSLSEVLTAASVAAAATAKRAMADAERAKAEKDDADKKFKAIKDSSVLRETLGVIV
jgi:hypothetical protein